MVMVTNFMCHKSFGRTCPGMGHIWPAAIRVRSSITYDQKKNLARYNLKQQCINLRLDGSNDHSKVFR